MDGLRNNPPRAFGGVTVTELRDYKTGVITDCATGAKSETGLPSSNVLYYKLENDDVIVARPSGTEPKIKFYYLLRGANEADCKAKLDGYKATLEAMTK
jgi:phosphoglucomutase